MDLIPYLQNQQPEDIKLLSSPAGRPWQLLLCKVDNYYKLRIQVRRETGNEEELAWDAPTEAEELFILHRTVLQWAVRFFINLDKKPDEAL